jgi:hypothetical protein
MGGRPWRCLERSRARWSSVTFGRWRRSRRRVTVEHAERWNGTGRGRVASEEAALRKGELKRIDCTADGRAGAWRRNTCRADRELGRRVVTDMVDDGRSETRTRRGSEQASAREFAGTWRRRGGSSAAPCEVAMRSERCSLMLASERGRRANFGRLEEIPESGGGGDRS